MKPGMQVLDIGANYGVYTLSMARGIGLEGCVWAFEPASATAAYLRCSIRDNEFENVEVVGGPCQITRELRACRWMITRSLMR